MQGLGVGVYKEGPPPSYSLGLSVGITMAISSISCNYKTYKYSYVTRGGPPCRVVVSVLRAALKSNHVL